MNFESKITALYPVFIYETAIVEKNVDIGDGTNAWYWAHVMSGATIGRNCVLRQNVFLGGSAILGNNVHVQNNVSIFNAVLLEDDVFCGASMVFTNVINLRSHAERRDEYRKTMVRKGVSIGANVTILCGNEIGEYAFIGAGSVITKPVSAFALVVGNPGKQIGWISKAGHRLSFDDNGVTICPETQEKYQLINNRINYVPE